MAAWPEPTKAERQHHNTALFKDVVLFAALIFALLRLSGGMEQLDAEAAKKGLDEAKSALAGAQTDLEKAEAQIGVDVYTSMVAATN